MSNTNNETKQAIQPRVNISESESGITLEAELPGVAKDKATVEVRDGKLLIEGTRETSTEKPTWHVHERPDADFYRAFEIGDTLDTSDIKATMADGVLTVQLSKKAEHSPKTITIN